MTILSIVAKFLIPAKAGMQGRIKPADKPYLTVVGSAYKIESAKHSSHYLTLFPIICGVCSLLYCLRAIRSTWGLI